MVVIFAKLVSIGEQIMYYKTNFLLDEINDGLRGKGGLPQSISKRHFLQKNVFHTFLNILKDFQIKIQK